MLKQPDIYKAGAVILCNRQLLVTRSHGKEVFVAPGGKLEAGETAVQAVIRELLEEVCIVVLPRDVVPIGSFTATAAGDESRIVHMEMFEVKTYSGKLRVANEIAELAWIDSTTTGLPLGSIIEHEVVPLLKQQNRIT